MVGRMADDQQFCLRWNNFQTNFTSQFKALRVEEDFVDVTLACDGKRIKAHKLVLSACSPYFKELFKGNPCKHPIIFMQDVEYEHVQSLVEFMYEGEVNICQTKLPAFLHTAESLQIRGLSAQSQHKLPQNSEWKVDDLRPAPTLDESLGREDSSDADLADDVRDDALCPSKRLCLPIENNSHYPLESTSYSDVPTTALIETKMEPMDYFSDNDVKPNISHSSNSDGHSMSRSGYSLQGALDAVASMSSQMSQLQDTPQESLQDSMGEMCRLPRPPAVDLANPVTTEPLKSQSVAALPTDSFKPHSLDPRPCPECGRIYSNISNLRQHIRLIHYPECITCPLCFKPFKNKLYLRRHVMSYHEINLPSQNDMRYKYTNVLNNQAGLAASSEAAEGKLTPETLAALFAPSKSDGKHSSEKKVPMLMEMSRNMAGSRYETERNVPSTLLQP